MTDMVNSRVEAEREKLGQATSPFDRPRCPVRGWMQELPPPRPERFEGVIPEGLVCAIGGPGGGGKSHVSCSMVLSAATGMPFGPFRPVGACSVMYLSLEDDEIELRRRFWSLGQAWSLNPVHLDALDSNLYVLPMVGRMGPLVELDPTGNPTTGAAYDQLCDAVVKLGIRFLIVDPKSRAYALDENRSDHATAWVQALERLVAIVPGLVVMFTHHSPKGLAGQDRMSADLVFRGSSGLADAIRWGAGLRTMTAGDAELYGVDHYRNFVELDLVKTNYAPQWPGPVYFERGPGGVLMPADLKRDRALLVAEAFARALADDGGQWSRRDLSRSGSGIKGKLKEVVPGWKASHLDRSIDAALRLGLVEEVQILSGPKSTPKLVLQPVAEPGA
ncbi:helicase RepA family protein [Patescibacteria group bacterium]|nr:helicase RepA family protein [Patescibacteria group bacterium]